MSAEIIKKLPNRDIGSYSDRPVAMFIASRKYRYALLDEPKSKDDREITCGKWGAFDRNMVGAYWFRAVDELTADEVREAAAEAERRGLPLNENIAARLRRIEKKA